MVTCGMCCGHATARLCPVAISGARKKSYPSIGMNSQTSFDFGRAPGACRFEWGSARKPGKSGKSPSFYGEIPKFSWSQGPARPEDGSRPLAPGRSMRSWRGWSEAPPARGWSFAPSPPEEDPSPPEEPVDSNGARLASPRARSRPDHAISTRKRSSARSNGLCIPAALPMIRNSRS
jgi:hypothetical protein